MTPPPGAPPVRPEDLPGIWRRASLLRPGAPPDTTTLVLWFQGRSLYADWRAPAEVDARPTRQEAFGGAIETAPEPDALLCEWRRDIDWGPTVPPPRDIGRLSWRRADLFEEGVADPYEEVWVREAAAGPNDLALRLRAEDGRLGFLVRVGSRFLWVRDRAPGAAARLQAGGDAAADILDFEASLGAVQGDGLFIERSSQSARAGDPLMAGALDDAGDALQLSERPQEGGRHLTTWRVEAMERGA